MKELLQEATEFIQESYQELGKSDIDMHQRLSHIKNEITETSTYTHSTEELTHGARMAWRNSNRCIGRLFWNSLHVIDAREATEAEEVLEKLLSHIEQATNAGKVKPIMMSSHRIIIFVFGIINYFVMLDMRQIMVLSEYSSFCTFHKCLQNSWLGRQRNDVRHSAPHRASG